MANFTKKTETHVGLLGTEAKAAGANYATELEGARERAESFPAQVRKFSHVIDSATGVMFDTDGSPKASDWARVAAVLEANECPDVKSHLRVMKALCGKSRNGSGGAARLREHGRLLMDAPAATKAALSAHGVDSYTTLRAFYRDPASGDDVRCVEFGSKHARTFPKGAKRDAEIAKLARLIAERCEKQDAKQDATEAKAAAGREAKAAKAKAAKVAKAERALAKAAA